MASRVAAMSAMLAGEYTTVDGLHTYYIRRGAGPALVLLHGQSPGSCAEVVWAENVEYFARAGFSVYALDQAGFGRTENPQDLSVETRIAHARSFIDSMSLDRYALWGASDGSYVAARIALTDSRVDALILMASGALSPRGPEQFQERARAVVERMRQYTPSRENARRILRDVLHNEDRVTDDLVEQVCAMSAGKNLDAHMRRAAAPRPRDIGGELKDLKAPSLLLWGMDDVGAPVERGLLLLKLIPHAELHVLNQCSHWPQRDQARRVNQLVKDFLGR